MTENEKSPVILAGAQGASFISGMFPLLLECTPESSLSQLCTSDSSELEKKFVPKKLESLRLAASYRRLGDLVRAGRVFECGNYLEFSHKLESLGVLSRESKLYKANFCKDRLCPMCGWRRTLKIYGQISRIMEEIYQNYRFIFLTLTIPNCESDQLGFTVGSLMGSWNRLTKCKRFKTSVLGYFRALEVTRNKKNGSYHPHFHCILAVNKDYAVNPDLYIPHSEWLDMWKKAAQDDSICQVNVKFVSPRHEVEDNRFIKQIHKAVAEVAKYTVKSADFLTDDDKLTDKIVSCLASSLRGRRLVTLGGVFKDTARSLKLDDMENGDLVHTDNDLRKDLAEVIIRYSWGIGCYKVTGLSLLKNDF